MSEKIVSIYQFLEKHNLDFRFTPETMEIFTTAKSEDYLVCEVTREFIRNTEPTIVDDFITYELNKALKEIQKG